MMEMEVGCSFGPIIEDTEESPFDRLPNEVLEFILSFLPPYKDLEECMLVNKRWNECAKEVLRKSESNLYKAIKEVNINWQNVTPPDMPPFISKRFYHASCVHKNSMYVFGGCTANSTVFNDLWRFDLSKRQWIRPLAMGTYPTPKAYATMVPYKDVLILFGGLTYPTQSPIFAGWTMFSEVHFYNTVSNRWTLINTINSPPPMGGHSAVIRGDTMVVCGGLYTPSVPHLPPSESNCDVWVLDLKTLSWHKQPTVGFNKPASRHGHSLIAIDKDHILILGGVKVKIYNDYWLLKMVGDVWNWFEVTVKNKEWSITHIWCNPACKVGDKVVTLSYEQNGSICPLILAARMSSIDRTEEQSVTQRLQQNMNRSVDIDNNVNGRRGMLPHHRQNSVTNNNINNNMGSDQNRLLNSVQAGPSSVHCNLSKITNRLTPLNSNNSGQSETKDLKNQNNIAKNDNNSNDIVNHNVQPNIRLKTSKPIHGMRVPIRIRDSNNIRMAAFATNSLLQHISMNRLITQQPIFQRQLDMQQVVNNTPSTPTIVKKTHRNTLALHVLDISTILDDNSHSVSWMQPQIGNVEGAPEEVIMYSLVKGKGELIMFGGLYYNKLSQKPQNFSNSLYFIVPPRNII